MLLKRKGLWNREGQIRGWNKSDIQGSLSLQLLHRFTLFLQSGSHRLHYGGLEKLRSSATHNGISINLCSKSTKLRDRHHNLLQTRSSFTALPFTGSLPGCQNLGRSDVGHHVEEIVAHEDPSLQQQEGETDAVPDDAGLISRQIADLFGCNANGDQTRSVWSISPIDFTSKKVKYSHVCMLLML